MTTVTRKHRKQPGNMTAERPKKPESGSFIYDLQKPMLEEPRQDHATLVPTTPKSGD